MIIVGKFDDFYKNQDEINIQERVKKYNDAVDRINEIIPKILEKYEQSPPKEYERSYGVYCWPLKRLTIGEKDLIYQDQKNKKPKLSGKFYLTENGKIISRVQVIKHPKHEDFYWQFGIEHKLTHISKDQYQAKCDEHDIDHDIGDWVENDKHPYYLYDILYIEYSITQTYELIKK